ncbi:MAG: DUF1282 domain-containing protein [Methanosarcinales archaeon]|nr:MAG: DUF1282 domain-containing protein [Methanosarcinales archaeon]
MGNWWGCCVMINGTPSLLSGLGDALRTISRSNVLTNPDRFFSELSESEVDLMTPVGIVLIWAIFNAINIVMAGVLLIRSFPDNAALSGIAIAVLVVPEIVMSFILWFIWAVAFYTVSMCFKGNGSFKRCLEFTGYGFIPIIAASVIRLAVSMVVLLTVEFPAESMELLADALMQNSLVRMIPVITCLFGLWSAYIGIFGVKHARKISTRDALITVGVPGVIAIVYYLNEVYMI